MSLLIHKQILILIIMETIRTEETNSLRNCIKVALLLYLALINGVLLFAGLVGIICNLLAK